MAFFLVTFSRRESAPPKIESYENPIEAMEKFIAAERHHRGAEDGLGVVLLIADDEATLRRTHTHYFATTDELIRSVGSVPAHS